MQKWLNSGLASMHLPDRNSRFFPYLKASWRSESEFCDQVRNSTSLLRFWSTSVVQTLADLMLHLMSCRLQPLLEKHAAGGTALEPAKLAQKVARKSMVLMAQKGAPTEPRDSIKPPAFDGAFPPTFAAQAAAADVRNSLLSGLIPAEPTSRGLETSERWDPA